MHSIPSPETGSILIVAAHPDDMESWCAGTLVQAIDQGATARLLLVTSGEHGSEDLTATPDSVARLREQEARAAAAVLGIKEVIFLHYPDGAVEDTADLRRDLVTWIRRWQPEVVFTHDPVHPEPPYLCHRDHRIVGRATLDAIYPLARDGLAYAELGLKPHKVRQTWLFASHQAQVCVDISAGLERKIEARLCHQSQTSDPEALRAGWKQRARTFGESIGVPLAETFAVVDIS